MGVRIEVNISGWRFVRVSSEYIDVYPPGSPYPVDNINVFDYEKGEGAPNTMTVVWDKAYDWMLDMEILDV